MARALYPVPHALLQAMHACMHACTHALLQAAGVTFLEAAQLAQEALKSSEDSGVVDPVRCPVEE